MDDDKEQDQNESEGNYDFIPSEDEEKMNEFSTSSGTTDNRDDGSKPKDIKERICDVCGKTFKDGRAFGGHKGSHSRTNQHHFLSKNIKKSDPSALDRGRRRVQPPQPPPPEVDRNGSSVSSSDSVDDSSSGSTYSKFTGYNIDLSKSLSNWSKSDRRGRGDTRAVWAAEVLLSITRGKHSTRPNQILPASNGGSTNCGSVTDSKKSELSISCMDKTIDSLDTEKQRMKKLVIDETKGHGKDQEHDERKNTSEDHGYQISKEKMKIKKKVTNHVRHSGTHDQEEEALGLIDKTQKMPRRYECRDCGKSYPTYQAMGGHRSVHKGMENKNTTNIASSVGDDQEESSPNNSIETDETKESDECFE